MGWKTSFLARASRLGCWLLAGAALAGNAPKAIAQSTYPFPVVCVGGQFPYTYWVGSTSLDDTVTTYCGPYLNILIGGGYDPATRVVAGKNQAGSYGVWTAPGGNADDPGGLGSNLLYYWPEIPPTAFNQLCGSHVYVRVDGGKLSGQLAGYDFDMGNMDPTIGGQWILPPTQVGNHIEAKWETSPAFIKYVIAGGATGTGGTGTGNGNGGTGTGTGTGTVPIVGSIVQPAMIEVDFKVSFVHDQSRWEFDVINNDTSSHTVGIAFIQDLSPNLNINTTSVINPSSGGTINKEVILTGAQVPASWSTTQITQAGNPLTGTQPLVHSIKGILRPTATSGAGTTPGTGGPTVPTRFVVGSSYYRIDQNAVAKLSAGNPLFGQPIYGNLNGNLGLASPTTREYEQIWSYQPDTTVTLNRSGQTREGIGLFWDPQIVAPRASLPPIVTYVGSNTSDFDFGTPLNLAVSAPQALSLISTNNTSVNSPNPFTISAYLTNNTDLQPTGGQTLAPVSVSLSLPAGLTLASGSSLSQQIVSIAPGQEAAPVTWSVIPDGSVSGTLSYTVTATPGNFGSGKIVQRSIQVPSQPIIPLKLNSQTNGQYQMVTLPFEFGSATPSQILFPGLNPNQAAPDVAYWNPINGNYATTSSFQPGDAYWVRNRLEVLPSPINTNLYPPVPNQTTAGDTYRVSYTQGWNQIGSPYIYTINFADVQVFDTTTLTLYSMTDASSAGVNDILPAAYYYDTSNSDPTQWQYVLLTDLGFTMQPYQGYWIYVLKPNLQFLYPPVTIPGSGLATRAVSKTTPPQLGKGTTNNWRMRLTAASTDGIDQYNFIGVAPGATDGPDSYKLGKPPVINKQLTLNIVHSSWTNGTLYAQDLRSPTVTTKTWDLTVKSPKPNENVTIGWPDLGSMVPRNYSLSLVDTVTNSTIDLRSRSAYTVNTGASGTRNLQIVAVPTQAVGRIEITSFDVAPPTRAAGKAPASLAINYALTRDAETHILVRDARGRSVRQLETGTRAPGTPNSGTVVWDLRNDQGIAISTGVYSLELNATTSDGQQARQTRQITVTR